MRLSRTGYGDLTTVENLPVDRFMYLIHYENYIEKYNKVANELNRK